MILFDGLAYRRYSSIAFPK